jgi:hypothetical protein
MMRTMKKFLFFVGTFLTLSPAIQASASPYFNLQERCGLVLANYFNSDYFNPRKLEFLQTFEYRKDLQSMIPTLSTYKWKKLSVKDNLNSDQLSDVWDGEKNIKGVKIHLRFYVSGAIQFDIETTEKNPRDLLDLKRQVIRAMMGTSRKFFTDSNEIEGLKISPWETSISTLKGSKEKQLVLTFAVKPQKSISTFFSNLESELKGRIVSTHFTMSEIIELRAWLAKSNDVNTMGYQASDWYILEHPTTVNSTFGFINP